MTGLLRQVWTDPVWSKLIAAAITAVAGVYAYTVRDKIVVAFAIAEDFLNLPTTFSKVIRFGIWTVAAAFAGYLAWLIIGRRLYRIWWARRAAFLPFRDAAARLYEKTKAADLLFDTGVPVSQDVGLGYHALQLVQYAKFRKATFYGNKEPSTVIVPIPLADLWTGRRSDDMRSWITENGDAYADLSLRHRDLKRVIRLVGREMAVHKAQLHPSGVKGNPVSDR